MKKSFKLIALFLAIAMLAVSLCSCRALDEMKANQTVYTSTDHTEIEYKGNIYRLVLNSSEISTGSYFFYWDKSAHVSDKDVPILLRIWFGDWIGINEDETVIEIYYNDMIDENAYIDDYGRVYYVREDRYDDAAQAIYEATGPL